MGGRNQWYATQCRDALRSAMNWRDMGDLRLAIKIKVKVGNEVGDGYLLQKYSRIP